MKKIALGILFTFLVAGSGLTFATVISSNTASVEVSDGLLDKDKKKKKKSCSSEEGGKKKCCASEKKAEGEQKSSEETK
jgi:hypothetical protein